MRILCKLSVFVLCLCLIMGLPPSVFAEEVLLAEDITARTTVTATGFSDCGFLTDGSTASYKSSSGDAGITLENESGIGGIYLLFDLEYGAYTVTDNTTGETASAGEKGFLHEFIDLDALFGSCPTSVTLTFSNGTVRLSEIYVYSAGETPNNVQRWDAPLEGGADLVLFATHGDDDQLFFAGMLPYYAGELGLRVQVVYLTDHRNLTNARTHEMLNGLWNVGVTAYPVFGAFADFRIDDLQQTYDTYLYSYGTTQEDLLSFVVEQVRRFKPLVAVGHDINGEYGHGMHMVYADLLIRSLELTADETAFPESAEAYGTWEIPKLYLHLYEENPITMDYDQPLEAFNGMTAFEVTQKLGYPCHESQQWTWFTGWLNGKSSQITQASQIETYNPCQFGLYRSTVGEDTLKNDFFENITTYAQQEKLEADRLEQERLEQERLEQERLEQERLEQERLEQERLEQERLEQERLEQERLRDERIAREQEQLQQRKKILLTGVFIVIPLLIGTMILSSERVRKKFFEKNL